MIILLPSFAKKASYFILIKEAQIDGAAFCDDLVSQELAEDSTFDAMKISALKFNQGLEYIKEQMKETIFKKRDEYGSEEFAIANKNILLNIIDDRWQNHIDTMTKLRSGIHLRSYSQKSPLQAYVEEGFNIFEDMKTSISMNIVYAIKSLEIEKKWY